MVISGSRARFYALLGARERVTVESCGRNHGVRRAVAALGGRVRCGCRARSRCGLRARTARSALDAAGGPDPAVRADYARSPRFPGLTPDSGLARARRALGGREPGSRAGVL